MRPYLRSLVGRATSLAGVALAAWPIIADAVTVAPHALFLGDRNRVGEVVLVNQSGTAEEIELDFQFGYPRSDSAGNVHVTLIENPEPGAPSAAGWLRAFPRRLRLEPGQRQTVRVQATPPDDLANGEYWSRMIVTSTQEQAPTLAQQADSIGVRAGLKFVLRTITSVTYRKGAVETRIRLDSLRADAANDSVIAWVGLTRAGSGAFLGSVGFTLLDADGAVVQDWDPTPVAAYYTLLRRYALKLDSLPAGTYQLRARVSTARQDIAAVHVLPTDPVEAGVRVDVR
jgi:hypothetical protein